MLKHCVFVQFKPEHAQAARDAVLAGFAKVSEDVPGMLDYCYGPNRDFENKSAVYRDGFIVTFTDRDAHLAYEAHPLHQEIGSKMVEMCEGGHAGIIVFDLEV